MIQVISFSSLIVLCAAVLESAVLSNISILPAVPDIVLICVLYLSIQNGKLAGETTGFISGLFLDAISACPFGLNCLIRTILGYLGGLFNKTLNTTGFFIPMLLGFCATIAKTVVVWIVALLYPSTVLSYNPFTIAFVFELAVNTILSPFIFKFLSLFENKIVLRMENMD